MREELISVIIPVYNTTNYLNKCITSVLNQSYKNLEVIIIDDGSTDDSYAICKQYAKSDKRIILKKTKNCGVSHARNYALSICRGKYIIFVDSDDFISLDMVRILFTNIKEKNADICMCGLSKVNEKYELLFEDKNNKTKVLSKEDFMKNAFDFNYSYGFPVNKLIKKSIISDIKFDEKIHYMEDFKFVCDIVQNAKTIVYVPDDLYFYLQRKDSSIHQRFDSRWVTRIDVQKEIINKYIKQFNDYSRDQFLFDYVMMLLSTYSYLKRYKTELETHKIQEIKNEIKKYYKGLMRSKHLNIYAKIKLFSKNAAPGIYFYLMEHGKESTGRAPKKIINGII